MLTNFDLALELLGLGHELYACRLILHHRFLSISCSLICLRFVLAKWTREHKSYESHAKVVTSHTNHFQQLLWWKAGNEECITEGA